MNALDNHMKNLSIIAGHPVTRYEYLMNTDDLTKAYMQSHSDLSYALRKEVKRDRFVANTEGLQKYIEKSIEQILNKVAKDIEAEITREVERQVLNTFSQMGAKVSGGNSSIKSSSFDIGAMLGRALGTSLVNLFDEISSDNDRNRH